MAEKKTFEVHIEQGMRPGQKITLRGEAGCTEPGLQPGDVVLVIQPREHETFKRPTASDLLIERHISLADALCGCNFQVKHLDGRVLQVGPGSWLVSTRGSTVVLPALCMCRGSTACFVLLQQQWFTTCWQGAALLPCCILACFMYSLSLLLSTAHW